MLLNKLVVTLLGIVAVAAALPTKSSANIDLDAGGVVKRQGDSGQCTAPE